MLLNGSMMSSCAWVHINGIFSSDCFASDWRLIDVQHQRLIFPFRYFSTTWYPYADGLRYSAKGQAHIMARNVLINKKKGFNTYMSNLEYSIHTSKNYADAERNSVVDWHGFNLWQHVTSWVVPAWIIGWINSLVRPLDLVQHVIICNLVYCN